MVQWPMQRIAITVGFRTYNPFGTVLMHYANDITSKQPVSDNVNAAHSGQCVMSNYDSAGGHMIAILGYFNEQCDILTRYGHLASRDIKSGDIVTIGQKIGVQGNTGTATTAKHLHFETWLVPKGYKYSFNDRSKYAVDPLSICHVVSGQEFVCDNDTYNLEGIPYPEPAVSNLTAVDGTLIVQNGGIRVRMLPFTKYPYMAKGYNRSETTLNALWVAKKQYVVTYTCEADGNKWALIITPLGPYWVAVLDGYTALTIHSVIKPPIIEPPAPTDDKDKQLAELQKKNSTYKQALETVHNVSGSAIG